MYIAVRRTHVYKGRALAINKEVAIHGRARAHASPLAFLSTYLCHEYSRASRIGFSIFDVSLARTLERSSECQGRHGRSNYPVRCGACRMRDRILFLSTNRAMSPHFRQNVAGEADEERP